jgi:hypothetical protein
VLEEASRSRIPTVQTGGVGVRELKRLAKAHGATTDELRLVLGTAYAAGLISTRLDGVTPTPEYDGWLEAEPAQRLGLLAGAWWSLPAMPTLATARPPELGRTSSAATGRPWVPTDTDGGAVGLRAAATPADRRRCAGRLGPPSPTCCAGTIHTVRRGDPAALIRAVEAWRNEAATLGVLGAGHLSAAGRALIDDHGLVEAFAGVGSVVRAAHLQADLTAVVPGTPAPALSTVLDAMADRESVAAASTWRFSPASIRRALDEGHTAGGLLADLAAIAAGPVPQALEYLIGDVARRHGAIGPAPSRAACAATTPPWLAEVAADRRLRGLLPRLLAPTVLGSAKPLPETLAALRKAGYAPVEEGPDGLPVLRQLAVRRTVGVRRTTPQPASPEPTGSRPARRRLMARPDESEPALMPVDPDLLWQYRLRTGRPRHRPGTPRTARHGSRAAGDVGGAGAGP